MSVMALLTPFHLESVALLLCLPLLGLACHDVDCGTGFCIEKEREQYVCICMGGYEGDRCERPIPVVRRSLKEYPCTETSCENGGTCVSLSGGEGELLGEPNNMDEESSNIGEVELDCGEVGMNCSYSCLCVTGFTGSTCAECKCVHLIL